MTKHPFTAELSPVSLVKILQEEEDYFPKWDRPTPLSGSIPPPDLSTFNAEQAIGFSKMVAFVDGKLTRKDPVSGVEYPVDMLTLEGVAGTGKTYVTQRVVQYLLNRNPDLSIGILTPTHQAGTAAKRLSNLVSLEQVKFATIHSVGGVRKRNDQKTGRETFPPVKPPKFEDFDVLFLDEAGMTAEELYLLVRGYATKVKFIWTGDPAQLPPVGEVDSKAYDTSEDFKVHQTGRVTIDRIQFTTPMRAALDSPITGAADRLRRRTARPKKFSSLINEHGARLVMGGPKDREHGIADELDYLLTSIFTSEHYQNDADYCSVLAWSNNCVGQWNRRIRRLIYRKNSGDMFGTPPVVFEDEFIKLQAAYVIPDEGEDEAGYMDVNTDEERGVQIYSNNEVLRVRSYEESTLIIPGTGAAIPLLNCTVEVFRFGIGWIERQDVPVVLSEALKAYDKAMWDLWKLVEQGVDTSLRAAYWDLKNYGPVQAKYAYASTVHKRQGCTDWLNIIDAKNIASSLYFPKTTEEAVRTDHYWRMIYTAGTRAAKAVVYLT